MSVKERILCRVCLSQQLIEVLDFGNTALANSYPISQDVVEDTYPLKVNLCNNCGAFQLSHSVDSNTLFKNYLYESSTSESLRNYFEEYAEDVFKRCPLSKGDLVVDIGCILPNNYVQTNKDFVETENIKKGDFVLTHDGTYKKVLKAFKKKVNKNCFKIYLKGLNIPIEVTNNHPILTDYGWRKAENLDKNDLIFTLDRFPFINHAKLKLTDYLDKEYFSIKNAKITPKTNGLKNLLPVEIDLNDDFFRVLGYYIGEGSSNGGLGILFTFNSNESEKFLFVKKYFETVFNIPCRLKTIRESTVSVVINSRLLEKIFKKLCGDGAKNKKIPNLLRRDKTTISFLKALWFIDGHFNKNGVYVYSTTSKKLAIQLSSLLSNCNINCSIQKVKNDRGFSVLDGFIYRLSIFDKLSLSNFKNLLKKENISFNLINYNLKKITKIEKFAYNGFVYNLEVDKNNNYISNRAIVHNSNDGILLKPFKDLGCEVLGVEPAENLAKVSVEKGISTVNDFFTSDTALDILNAYNRRPKLITCNNCFAHVDNLRPIMEGVKLLLDETGFFIFENAYWKDTVENMFFDQVYHEHFYYHTLASLCYMFSHQDMLLYDVERTTSQGGSIRCFVKNKKGMAKSKVYQMVEEEESSGLYETKTYEKLNSKIRDLGKKLSDLINEHRLEGHGICAYGAPAKFTTFSKALGLTNKEIDFVVEDARLKQGRFTPDTKIPIVGPEEFYKVKPEVCIITAWNFADSIIEKHQKYLDEGGTFIVPFPTLKIIKK